MTEFLTLELKLPKCVKELVDGGREGESAPKGILKSLPD
jgi:hypothetical protein